MFSHFSSTSFIMLHLGFQLFTHMCMFNLHWNLCDFLRPLFDGGRPFITVPLHQGSISEWKHPPILLHGISTQSMPSRNKMICLNVKNKENPLVQHISAITCRNDHHWSDTVLKLEGISHLMFVGPAYLGVVNPQKHEPIKTQNFNTKQSLLVSQISQVPHSRKIPSLNLAYLATGLCN